MATITKQVKDLNVGDDLGNCVVLAKPEPVAFTGPYKDKVSIKVRFKNGSESLRMWGKYTTVTVLIESPQVITEGHNKGLRYVSDDVGYVDQDEEYY